MHSIQIFKTWAIQAWNERYEPGIQKSVFWLPISLPFILPFHSRPGTISRQTHQYRTTRTWWESKQWPTAGGSRWRVTLAPRFRRSSTQGNNGLNARPSLTCLTKETADLAGLVEFWSRWQVPSVESPFRLTAIRQRQLTIFYAGCRWCIRLLWPTLHRL